MKISYKVIGKRSPRDPEGPLKYYAVLKRKGTTSTKGLCKLIANKSGLHPAILEASIVAMATEIQNELAEGRAVKIDGLGTFSLKVNSEGKPTAEQIRAHHIQAAKINFHSDASLKKLLKKLSFYRPRKA